MIVNAVHEHSVQQMTFCTRRRVLQHDEVAMMLGHRRGRARRPRRGRRRAGARERPGRSRPWRRRARRSAESTVSSARWREVLDRPGAALKPRASKRGLDRVDALLDGRDRRVGSRVISHGVPDFGACVGEGETQYFPCREGGQAGAGLPDVSCLDTRPAAARFRTQPTARRRTPNKKPATTAGFSWPAAHLPGRAGSQAVRRPEYSTLACPWAPGSLRS